MSTFEEYAKSWSNKKNTHQHLVWFCCWFHFKTFYGYYSGNCVFLLKNCVFLDSLMFENVLLFILFRLKSKEFCNMQQCVYIREHKKTWWIPSSSTAKVFQPTQLCKCVFLKLMNAKFIDTSLTVRKYNILPRQWPFVLVRSESSDHKLFWSVE